MCVFECDEDDDGIHHPSILLFNDMCCVKINKFTERKKKRTEQN